MPTFATPEGTRRYTRRFAGRAAQGHFREQQGLLLSSIGLGTYLGEPDARTDQAYTDAVIAAVTGGINFIDSAINYRFQRSERSIGAALKKLAELGYGRDELVLCTKGGFLTPDGEMPDDPSAYFFREYVESGIICVDDIAEGCHAMTPRYLEDQLGRSLRNLGVDGIDLYYLHNPETQLGAIPHDQFVLRVRTAFEYLESAVSAGKIQFYGMATWNAFRQPETARDYLSLGELEIVAHEIAGDAHHFRFVQLPHNLAMTEALTRANQVLDTRKLPMIEAANALEITLIASASLLQAQMARNLPPFIAEVLGLENDAQRALQFVRSSPGITTALVGMSSAAHVQANLTLAGVEPASLEQFEKLFQRGKSARPKQP